MQSKTRERISLSMLVLVVTSTMQKQAVSYTLTCFRIPEIAQSNCAARSTQCSLSEQAFFIDKLFVRTAKKISSFTRSQMALSSPSAKTQLILFSNSEDDNLNDVLWIFCIRASIPPSPYKYRRWIPSVAELQYFECNARLAFETTIDRYLFAYQKRQNRFLALFQCEF